jgi:hypothetical protein
VQVVDSDVGVVPHCDRDVRVPRQLLNNARRDARLDQSVDERHSQCMDVDSPTFLIGQPDACTLAIYLEPLEDVGGDREDRVRRLAFNVLAQPVG